MWLSNQAVQKYEWCGEQGEGKHRRDGEAGESTPGKEKLEKGDGVRKDCEKEVKIITEDIEKPTRSLARK